MVTKLRFMRSFKATTRVTLQEVGVQPTAENRPRVPSLQHRGRASTASQHVEHLLLAASIDLMCTFLCP